MPLAPSAPAVYSVVTPINTVLLGWTRNFRFYRFTQLLMTLVLPWVVLMSLGGFRQSSVVIVWAALCPLCSLLVEELRQTVLWIVGFVLLLIVSAILQPHLTPAALPEAFVTWFFVLNLGSVIAIVFALLYNFVGQRNFFQERSETLLLNILPKEIAEALKTDRSAIATHYEPASVLFADVVGFTPMAATMTPLRVVKLLNDVFHCFDDLVEKYDLEKIKTIGDCYMVPAGVPRERPDHAVALVQLALDMRERVASRTFGDQKLAFRIGINALLGRTLDARPAVEAGLAMNPTFTIFPLSCRRRERQLDLSFAAPTRLRRPAQGGSAGAMTAASPPRRDPRRRRSLGTRARWARTRRGQRGECVNVPTRRVLVNC